MEKLKEDIVRLARELGIDLIGVAPVERFAAAPEGHKPQDLLHGARSVICLAARIPKGTLRTAPNYSFMQFGWYRLNEILNLANYRLSVLLEERNFEAMPMPATYDSGAPEVLSEEPDPEIRYMASFSLRHAAELAGLGQVGLAGPIITREFGANVRLGAVLTTAELPADPVFEEQLCQPEICGYLCVKICPWEALSKQEPLSHIRCVFGETGIHGLIDEFKQQGEQSDLLNAAMSYATATPPICARCQIQCPMDPRLTELPGKMREKGHLPPLPESTASIAV